MKELLFLAHRVPYPPNKGDKIRSFHFLKRLAETYRVHLGTFMDSAADAEGREPLAKLCGETCLVPLAPWKARFNAGVALLSSQPLSVPYYDSSTLRRWVSDLMARRPIERVFVFSSQMAQHAPARAGVRRVLDFCDIDSDKWRQYAARKHGLPGWVYSREARLLSGLENRLAQDFDASLFVSEREAQHFREQAPAAAHKVHVVRNGVDVSYFDPQRSYPRALESRGPVLVFTGAMDYWANVEAVCWFASEVFARIRAVHPEVTFCIVGSNPARAVQDLARQPGVVVTGAVADVRPYLAHADVSVAPLRIARGVQNKVLEAMSMALPVVACPAALDGLDGPVAKRARSASSADSFAQAVLEVLAQPDRRAVGSENRRAVCASYAWGANLDRLVALLEGETPEAAPAPRVAAH
jgi:sugar transferase (PEP-CTERM/EpsH1 system associated)